MGEFLKKKNVGELWRKKIFEKTKMWVNFLRKKECGGNFGGKTMWGNFLREKNVGRTFEEKNVGGTFEELLKKMWGNF